MKTLFYLLAFCCCIQFNAKAQSNPVYQLDEFKTEPIIKKNDCDGLKPVFYNFTRRRLYTSNRMPLNGRYFLELCRNINDPNVQLQVRRYDQLTSNKKKLVGAMIFAAVAGYFTTMGSVVALSGSGRTPVAAYTTLGLGLTSLCIATPILAISTGIPHQKRKEILFHDLPEAYNFYVTTQPNH